MSQEQAKPALLDYFPDDDGYTLDAFIAAVPLMHNDVRIKFRPTDIPERSIYIAFRDKANEKALTEKLGNILASKIESWNLTRQVGENEFVPMEIIPDRIKRLKPILWMRLVNIVVWGVDGGDLDPGFTAKQMSDELENDINALMEKGQAIIDKRLEDARKN